MPKYCPKCENEILPYLKTGEVKQIVKDEIVDYQCYFCVHCKVVYHQEHERRKFIKFNVKELKDALTSKKRNKIIG